MAEKFKEAFDMYDKDGNGLITNTGLGAVMNSLCQETTKAELEGMINQVTGDRNSTVNFSQFSELMAQDFEDTEEAQKAAFKVFDNDNSGFISAEMLRRVMTNLGDNLSKEEVNEMIKQLIRMVMAK